MFPDPRHPSADPNTPILIILDSTNEQDSNVLNGSQGVDCVIEDY